MQYGTNMENGRLQNHHIHCQCYSNWKYDRALPQTASAFLLILQTILTYIFVIT